MTFPLERLTNTDNCAADFAPFGHHVEGHMLKIVVSKKMPFKLLMIKLIARFEVSLTFGLSVPLGVVTSISSYRVHIKIR